MNVVGICGLVRLVSLLGLVLLLRGGGVQSKAIGSVTTEEPPIDNGIVVASSSSSSSTEFSIGGTSEETEIRTTTEEVPTIDREHVTLRIPDELFSSTANLTLRLRDFLGQLLLRSVARLAKMMRFVQPLFGGHLVIEIPKDLEKI
ncbi:uncharacterized protein LOC109402069 [Aedes albopictus]|uniref:Secreted protein n=1 Tax=Aedes albopictus TaxID=7160 RepID=A0ABM1ZT08_AEDAL|nr:uncharacterized protein LOC109402069 [Aedes albopictus]